MAGQGRIERARELLRRLADPKPASPESDSEPDTAPEVEEPIAVVESTENAEAPEALGETQQEEEEEHSGLGPLSLGDIDENRRESVARRLGALRERAPRSRAQPATPEAQGGEDAQGGMGSRLASLRAAAGGLGSGSGTIGERARRLRSGAASAGKPVAGAWRDLPKVTRVRLAAAAIVTGLAAIVLVVVVPAAPCGAPGGDECAPPDDAIEIVPDDALAYAHVDIDPESAQYQAAAEVASRLPLLSRLLIGEFAGIAGDNVDFTTQVRPWAGGELAVALLPGAGRLERIVMVEAADVEGAEAFAAELLGPATATEDVGGTPVTSTLDGAASAVFDGFLLLGDADALEGVIDPADEGGTLASGTAGEALDDLSEQRLGYAYLSGDGARALLGGGGGLAPLDTFVDSEAATGVAVALTAADGLIELEIVSELDPEAAEASPPFFAALPPFEPTLPADVGSDALAYVGIGDPQASIESLLTRAAADAPALLAAFNRVEEDLRREAGISLTGELLSLLGAEAALSVEPVLAEGEAPVPGVLAPSGVPYVSLIADGVDTEAATRSLAALQKPLIELLGPAGSGKLAAFEVARIAGVEAQSLLVNPDVNLTYATFDDRLVVATNPIGVEQARTEGEGLAAAPGFAEVTGGLPGEVSLLSYFDLRSLLALGEQIGLSADPAYATLAPDLRTLDAAALAVSGSGSQIRTDLRIAVGEPETAQVAPSPLADE